MRMPCRVTTRAVAHWPGLRGWPRARDWGRRGFGRGSLNDGARRVETRMADGVAFAGGIAGWRELRLDSGCLVGWCARARERSSLEPAPLPLHAQTHADLEAAQWGRLAWEDPRVLCDSSPFWADTAMLEGRFARPEESLALVAQMDQVGGTPTGFRLLDGGLVLRLAQGRKTTQVGLANTVAADAVRSRLMVLTPVDEALRVLHRSAAGVGSGGSSVTVRAWRPRRVERRRPVTFCQAVRARNGGGGERPQCAEIRRLRAPNSAAGRTIPRADGTITAAVPGAWTNHRSGLTSHIWRWVESACVMLMVAKNCGEFPRLEKSN